MTQTMKIMAAVDLSDYSKTIIRYSGWLAKRLAAELLLVNVVNQRDIDMVGRAMAGYESFSFPNYITEQEQDRKARMKDLVEEASPEPVQCTYLVQTGIPYRELLALIESEKPQMVVVGTKGRSNLADAVVGSTARKLYRRTPVPLVTIPAGFDELP
jgi:nucleotide-binding universal stress UspA family protein